MATKKDKKTTDIQKKLEEARKLRLEQAKNIAISKVDESKNYKEEWDLFWVKNRKSYSETKELGEIIWLHLKAIKHDKPEKFIEGIKNFGINKGDK